MGTNRNSSYYRNLIQRVLHNSDAPNWDHTVLEWEVFNCEEDETLARKIIKIHTRHQSDAIVPC